MSTNTWAVDELNKRVFDLGNHSTALIPVGCSSVRYTADALAVARDNVRIIQRNKGRSISYGVDVSGKAATDACVRWMRLYGIEIVELVTEGCAAPWEAEDGTYAEDWTYYTPFSNPHVSPDPYTCCGETFFSGQEDPDV